jgi:two-component system cell cycle sensor histidine kinase/response regulator CckA
LTLTRKVGCLLLLLTAGSLAGIISFVLFLTNTATDGLFLIAAHLEHSMVQDIEIKTLAIRDGQDEARPLEIKLLSGFDTLLDVMNNGGLRPGKPIAVLMQVLGHAYDADFEHVVPAFQESLPVPPLDLKQRISGVQSIWLEVEEPLRIIAEKPVNDPDARAAYDRIKPQLAELDLASRLMLSGVAYRITSARGRMLVTLAAISTLSLSLFLFGLWFTRRYVSLPVELIEKAARHVSAGNYDQRVPIIGSGELAVLATAMNEMCGAVEQAVAQYREILENAGDIIYTMSLEGRFLTVNRAGERILGYTRDEFLKLNVDRILAPEQLEFSKQMFEKKMSGEQSTTTYTLQVLHRDGHVVWLEVGTRLIYENGKPVAVQGTARDRTERRRLEEQLWTAQKMEAVGRLAGGIAHEFGNVLTIITGYSALLESGLKDDDELLDEVRGIQRASQRAASLVRHLLGFSKGQVFRPKTMDVRVAINEIGDMLRHLIGDDIRLKMVSDADLGFIRFDPAQLEQVLVNLALNARDAMPGGGEFAVNVENVDLTESIKNGNDEVPAGRYIRLQISDTGIGMSPDVVSRIFEPFFSMKERGTGLGLSTVYGIVHQAGGSIAAESAIDQGTTFTIFLPRVLSMTEKATLEERAPTPALGTETILLVEDNADVRDMVCEMLRTRGYNVIAADDQQQALFICRQTDRRIDLMLTDVVMPEVSGPELASRVRSIRPAMPVLYMSGYTEDKFESYVENKEAFEFIQKPLNPETLATKVREVLDAPRRNPKDGTNHENSSS